MSKGSGAVYNLCAVVCGNGFGHLRRTVAVLDALMTQYPMLQVALCASACDLSSLQRWAPARRLLESHSLTLYDYISQAPEQWALANSSGLPNATAEVLRTIRAADVVLSDNIVQVLDVRPDTILLGSFFWHEVLNAADPEKYARFVLSCEELLSKEQPLCIGVSDFATPGVQSQPNFSPVGLYSYGERSLAVEKGNGLLISLGKSGRFSLSYKAVLAVLERFTELRDTTVWLEPSVIPDSENLPKNIRPATFTPEMYAEVTAVCSRPGMGTLSDALLAGARFFALFEKNFEMEHNADVLERLGLGERVQSLEDGMQKCMSYLHSPHLQRQHLSSAAGLKGDGVERTVKIISEYAGLI